MTELVSLRGDARAPSYSPDGRWLAFIGTDVDMPTIADPERVFLATAAGRNVRCLTPELDDGVGGWAWADPPANASASRAKTTATSGASTPTGSSANAMAACISNAKPSPSAVRCPPHWLG